MHFHALLQGIFLTQRWNAHLVSPVLVGRFFTTSGTWQAQDSISGRGQNCSLGLVWWGLKVKVAQSSPTLCDPMAYTIHGILWARILEWVAFPFSRGIKPRSPALQADSLPAKPQGKPKNTGVGSLSLLQRIFPSQELN